MQIEFEFSDTISGYVVEGLSDSRGFSMETTDGRRFDVRLAATAYAQVVRNLDDPYRDATGRMQTMLQPGQMVIAYGTFYPEPDGAAFEAQALHLPRDETGRYVFEDPKWWIQQASSIANFFIDAQFGKCGEYNYDNYRTVIDLAGKHTDTSRQETDTISRMVYGLASTFLLTGEDRFLECAEAGVQYLRDHMRFYDMDERVVYWYHGIDVSGGTEHKVFASEFGDDYDAIPMYEQIYALAGPAQTYRINGDPKIHEDINLTLDLFERFFKDPEQGGYFSHIDPMGMSPHAESLGPNRARKNWNSVGDHAPAYLINAWLALDDDRCRDILIDCADMICAHFPDEPNSPFVQERFFADWSPDTGWGWQQDRAVVGHNLKIAWNLMRINSMAPKDTYVETARRIAHLMPSVGMDVQRFGWYDVMDRRLEPGQTHRRFTWHDRKAWWQQEQGILAYQILYGCLGDQDFLKYGREGAAFYNTFFLDHDDGSVYFNVLNNGVPYLLGTERFKGSHSMSCYHSIELAYLSAVYTNLLNTGEPLDLYFKPHTASFPDRILRVSPDILPPGRVRIAAVWMDGEPFNDFDPEALTVKLPTLNHRAKFKVRLDPVK
jgi:mannose/cellobiose epimerase-like protein (N-acyl-D-glucosamine 2-epimerase family)